MPYVAPNLISDDVLESLLDAFLPRRPKLRFSFDKLITASDTERALLTHGAWCAWHPDHTTPSPTNPVDRHDEAGWFIVNWPVFLRRALTSPAALPILKNAFYNDFLRRLSYKEKAANIYGWYLETDDPTYDGFEYFDDQWQRWRRHFENSMLPPGCVFRDYDNQALSIFSEPFKAGEDSLTNLSVVRFGPLLSNPGMHLTASLSRWRVFRQLHRISPEVIDRAPKLIKTLYYALLLCSDSLDPYAEWGLAWTSSGLYFHFGRALTRIHSDFRLRSTFPNDPHIDGGDFATPHYTSQRVHRSLPPLVQISESIEQNLDFIRHELGPYNLTFDPANYPSFEKDNYYSIFFPLVGGSRTGVRPSSLVTYLETLIELSEATSASAIAPLPRSRSGKKPKTPEDRLRHRNIVSVHLAGTELRADPTEPFTGRPKPLTLRLCKWYQEYYIAFPDQLLVEVDTLNNPRWFKRGTLDKLPKNDFGETCYITTTGQKHSIAHLPRADTGNAQAVMSVDNLLFFHPRLLTPHGEVWSFLDMIEQAYPHVSAEFHRNIQSFRNLLYWIFEPDAILERGPNSPFVGQELEALIDPESGSPVILTNYQERLQFLFEKAEHTQDLKVRADSPTTKEGKQLRSRRFNNYDRWAIWMGEKEFAHLGLKLTHRQYREFIARRWVPWRTPETLTMIKAPIYRELEVLKGLSFEDVDKDADIAALVDKVNEEHGYSYSELRQL